MNHPPPLSRSIRLTLAFLGSCALLLGMLVMVGWYSGNDKLIRVLPGLYEMAMITAVAFTLSGCGLLAILRPQPLISRLLGLMVTLIGMLRLSEYLFALDLQINQLLLGRQTSAYMAVVTAYAFTLVGVSIMVMSHRSSERSRAMLLGLLGSAIAAAATATFFGYVIGLVTNYSSWYFTGIALHTAIGLILISMAILAVAWADDDRSSVIGLPGWLPFAAAITALTFTFYLWQALARQYQLLKVATSPLPVAVLTMGVITALLLMLALHFAETARTVAQALKQAHGEVEARVAARTLELQQQIEERHRAEEQIRAQAELLDKTNEAIIVRALDDQILFWNKGAERLYGWTESEMIGRPAGLLLQPGQSEQIAEAHRNVMARGEWAGELDKVTREGRKITVECHWTLIWDDESQPRSIIDINTDITEKKIISAQVARAQRMEAIGTLAGGVAHDLNNTLSPILMAASLLTACCEDEQQQNLADIIKRSGERGADMVKQILTFARGVECERINLQPRHLLKELRQMLMQTFPKSIVIESWVAPDLWPVCGDSTQLYQALVNLCINARDAMPEGGRLTLRAENRYLDETYTRLHINTPPGNYVVITVTDTGKGIAPELKEKIFEPFFTTKELGKGTGLGLATTLGIIKSHGGNIEVYSEIDKGTKFSIYLPAAVSVAVDARKSVAAPLGRGELILVVDDEASIREISKVALEAHGYQVMLAEDGTAALAQYAKHAGDIKLVLLDMVMPYLDGAATLQALKRLDPQAKIVCTSGFSKDDNFKVKREEITAFLAKPYTHDQLLTVIAAALAQPDKATPAETGQPARQTVNLPSLTGNNAHPFPL